MSKPLRKLFVLSLVILVGCLTVYYFYPERKFPKDKTIDKIEVYKSKGQLLAFSQGQLIKTYKVSIGRKPVGQKQYEGDKRTPEGMYVIDGKNAHSSFHKNLSVSYPNLQDVQRAKELGKSVGGEIKIHGLHNGLGSIGKFQRWVNWTAGCIALTNDEVDELFEHTPVGTTIEIKP